MQQQQQSATAAPDAAQQRLAALHAQLAAHRARLAQQDAALRQLQSEMALTRTVVRVTLPAEIGRAARDYRKALCEFSLLLVVLPWLD